MRHGAHGSACLPRELRVCDATETFRLLPRASCLSAEQPFSARQCAARASVSTRARRQGRSLSHAQWALQWSQHARIGRTPLISHPASVTETISNRTAHRPDAQPMRGRCSPRSWHPVHLPCPQPSARCRRLATRQGFVPERPERNLDCHRSHGGCRRHAGTARANGPCPPAAALPPTHRCPVRPPPLPHHRHRLPPLLHPRPWPRHRPRPCPYHGCHSPLCWTQPLAP